MDAGIIQHKDLSESTRWAEMPLTLQLANVGSEVFRAGKWMQKGKKERAMAAADRALELLDFTISSAQEKHGDLKELLRLREVLCDFFYGDNDFDSTAESLNHYFDPFAYKAAKLRSGNVSEPTEMNR